MKNILTQGALIVALTISIFFLSGCKKFLERDNPTSTTDELFWKSQDQILNYLSAIYTNALPAGALITDGGTFQANSKMQMEGITDLAVHRANFGPTWTNFVLNNVTSTDGYINDLYKFNYANSRDCSRILERYQTVFIADPVLKKRIVAEARALRAYSHLKLFMMFGNVPILDHEIEFADADAKNLPRATTQQLVDFIGAQLDTASVDLPNSYSEADLFRMSKTVCYALQVQLYLHAKQYDKVITSFTKLRALNTVQLYTTAASGSTAYADLFNYNGLTNNERIWIKPLGNKGIMGRMGPASVTNGQATLSPTAALVDMYETKQGLTLDELPAAQKLDYIKSPNLNNNRDPRLNATVILPGTNVLTGLPYQPFNTATTNTTRLGYNSANATGYLLRKGITETDRTAGFGNSKLNYIIIRYAEMMLSYVEALVESGQFTHPDVKLFLNQIRSRAGMPNIDDTKYNTQAKLRELYRRERTVELALEGNRVFDIRRWQIGTQVLNGPVYGAFDPATNQPVLVENRTFVAPRDYLFPIPQTEMINNAGLKGENNPGW